jgi:ribonuclease Z
VDHAPATPAVGYRFDYAGRALVISGDTRRCDEVRRAADGADLLAHEALATDLVGVLHDAAVSAERFGLARITHDIPDYHATPMEAAATAAEAGVRHLLLYHIVPPLPVPGLASRFLEGLDKVFDGPVTLSRDGTFVSLPAGSSAVTVSQRL